jgi:DNA-binding response OmpR family regulator
LIRVLGQQRTPNDGWQFLALDGPVEADGVVILDIDDPKDYPGCAKRIRADGFAGPILVIGNDGTVSSPDDELLPRPVRLGTLLARLDAHWAKLAEAECYRLGPYDFIPAERLLRHPDGSIRLTDLEGKLLAYLAESEDGALIGREQLLSSVWGYSVGVATHTVETHIWRLRQKIETDDAATRFLVTEAGGYRLILAQSPQDR